MKLRKLLSCTLISIQWESWFTELLKAATVTVASDKGNRGLGSYFVSTRILKGLIRPYSQLGSEHTCLRDSFRLTVSEPGA